VGGLAKLYLVPGWRLGWILLHDPVGALVNIHDGLVRLAQLNMGACSLVQCALPRILATTQKKFFQTSRDKLTRAAMLIQRELEGVPGLKMVLPEGAMYAMIRVCRHDIGGQRLGIPEEGNEEEEEEEDREKEEGVEDEMEFLERLMREESVQVLPGTCFGAPGYFRVVLTVPENKLKEACKRIKRCFLRWKGDM